LNGGVAENLAVAGVTAAEDTYPFELSASFLHSKSILSLLFLFFSFLFLFVVYDMICFIYK